MPDASPPNATWRFRAPTLIAGFAVAAIAAVAGWLTVGSATGCGAETPAVFRHLYHVTSATMEPALKEGDWLWAERRLYCSRAPERGDLAALSLPSRPGAVFIRRVIGLPGDRIQLQQGQLYLNGEAVHRDWLDSAIHADETGEPTQRTHFTETLPTGARYTVEVADTNAPVENTGEITVPEGQYFVLGDNRDHSEDSRAADFGLVPRGAIADRPVRVLWSGDTSRIWLRLSDRP